MEISENATLFIERCFNKGESRIISPYFNTKYTFGDKEIIFTPALFDEMKQSNAIKVLYENDKTVNIIGIEGMLPKRKKKIS